MPSTETCLALGAVAPDFSLPGVDGRSWCYADAAGANGLVVMFICNHCPYVKAVADRIATEAQALQRIGVGAVAINSNDSRTYPEDSFDQMKLFAKQHAFGFPYLHDASQEIARAYGAQCTPEFYGFDRGRLLRYHGRLDASGRQAPASGAKRELFDAMQQVVDEEKGPEVQHASIGCSIKWLRG